jgi:drug/metabolite transporter (DMT)-like permease
LAAFSSAFSNLQPSYGRTLPRFAVTERTQAKPTSETVQDETVDAPASVVYYDDFLDDSLPDGVVCARGLCVLADYDEVIDEDAGLVGKVLNSYLGPRLLLAGASILYGTNFPLGVMMNDALPPSAGVCARTVLAAAALSPFLFKLSPKLSGPAMLCGCFTALGYTTQALALKEISPATVAFLGAATVIVCPTLSAVVDKKPMGIKDTPQTWLAAILCLAGVGVLELYDPSGGEMLDVGFGDVLALLQAVGFGTSFFLTERMMRGQPDQALPITAVQVSMTALISMIWCLSDGWIGTPGSESFALPGMFLEPSIRTAAGAVAWTGEDFLDRVYYSSTSGLTFFLSLFFYRAHHNGGESRCRNRVAGESVFCRSVCNSCYRTVMGRPLCCMVAFGKLWTK